MLIDSIRRLLTSHVKGLKLASLIHPLQLQPLETETISSM